MLSAQPHRSGKKFAIEIFKLLAVFTSNKYFKPMDLYLFVRLIIPILGQVFGKPLYPFKFLRNKKTTRQRWCLRMFLIGKIWT